jgi:hypothetical protein
MSTNPSTHTPWGRPDTITEIAPGITFYSTPSHGGYHLSPARIASMPKPLRDFQPFAGPGFYEEDCDWSIVCLAFPQFFPADAIPAAMNTLKHSKPEIYEEAKAMREGRGA